MTICPHSRFGLRPAALIERPQVVGAPVVDDLDNRQQAPLDGAPGERLHFSPVLEERQGFGPERASMGASSAFLPVMVGISIEPKPYRPVRAGAVIAIGLANEPHPAPQ